MERVMEPETQTQKKEFRVGECQFCSELSRWSVRADDHGLEDWFPLCDRHLAVGIMHGLENGRYQITFARLAR
jgi:hypothetical protein